MSLYERMQAISNEVRSLSKDMIVSPNTTSEYRAVSDKSVTLAVKDAESKWGIVSIPIRQDVIAQETIKGEPDKYGKIKYTYADTVKMTVRFMCVEAASPAGARSAPVEGVDYIDIETLARGVDSSDKGFGKASTYARKYALLNAYKIATGEDPDAEKSAETTAIVTPDEKRLAVINFLSKDEKTKDKVCVRFAVLDLDELDNTQIDQIYEGYHKKGQL